MGYLGGYISKRQKLGRFELKQSIAAQPHFLEKMRRENCRESAQIAHMTNRMFGHLEGRGILRSGVEDVLLSAEYNKADPLAAEFIRTFRQRLFSGKAHLDRYHAIREKITPRLENAYRK